MQAEGEKRKKEGEGERLRAFAHLSARIKALCVKTGSRCISVCVCVPVHMCVYLHGGVAVMAGSRSVSCCVVALGCGSHGGGVCGDGGRRGGG